jgi:copper homeostasis protein
MRVGGPAVEIAVQDAAGARAALDAGADRLELCQALETGGLTPSLGILESVLAAVDPLSVNVLVRPRAGGFVYSSEEVAVVEADIRVCVQRAKVPSKDEHVVTSQAVAVSC